MSERSEPLSRDARGLIEAARGADEPSRADRERVQRALGVALAASAGAAAGTKAIGSSATSTAFGAATSSAVAAKVAIVVVALGVVAGGAIAWNAATRPPTATPLAPRTTPLPRAALAEPIPSATPELAPPADDAPELAAPEADVPALGVAELPRRGSAPRTDPVPPSIDDETLVLRDAIAHGASLDARLASIDAHAARFPAGQLAPVRESARARAVRDLCADGTATVSRYLAAHPTGATTVLLRETCPAHP